MPPYPAVVPDGLLALVTGVGKVGIIAGDAEGPLVHLDVFAPIEGLLAAGAVKAFSHPAAGWDSAQGSWEKREESGC